MGKKAVILDTDGTVINVVIVDDDFFEPTYLGYVYSLEIEAGPGDRWDGKQVIRAHPNDDFPEWTGEEKVDPE